jgi:hypothetical protein
VATGRIHTLTKKIMERETGIRVRSHDERKNNEKKTYTLEAESVTKRRDGGSRRYERTTYSFEAGY